MEKGGALGNARWEAEKRNCLRRNRCVISSGWLLWKAMQMLFNPSASHFSPQRLFREAFLLFCMLFHWFSAAVYPNKTWLLHYTFECCAGTMQINQHKSVHSAKVAQQKVMHVIFLTMYKNPGTFISELPFDVQQRVEKHKIILICFS